MKENRKKSKKGDKANNIKVAVVSDPLYKHGGAESHLKYILEAFPNSELFTAYHKEDFTNEFFPDVKIHHSFMQHLPARDKLRQFYLLFQPLAYRLFRFKDFDIVVSLSIGFSKFVRPKKIKHVNICMSPPKFLWQKKSRSLKDEKQLTGVNKLLFKFYNFFTDTFLERIWKRWDRNAARRCNKIAAISNVVKERVKKYYDYDADVIYPPVEVAKIKVAKKVNRKENWFLYLGRVETYKGVDLAIKACVKAGVPLKIAGKGDHFEAMRELVKKLNARGLVKFLGYVSEEQKINLLSRAKALIFPVRDEDFGIVPVEANAAGTPVIAYKEGGVLETISEDNPKTGVFFEKYTIKELAKILRNFDSEEFNQDNCRKQADNFASEIFVYKLQNYVKDALQEN
jgi:glycosyltransferase involved in cell wall biosynthesis